MTLTVYPQNDYKEIAPSLYGSGFATLQGASEPLSTSPAEYLVAATSFEELLRCSRTCNGHWVYIQARPDVVWAAVDRCASRPLYYRKTEQGIAFSSNGYDLLRPGDEIDQDAAFIFRYKGFTDTSSTLSTAINRIPPGHCLQLKEGGEVELKSYLPVGAELLDISYYEAKERAKELLLGASERLLKRIGDRPMIVLLTAGLDSRFIAYALARAGKSDQVLALTYGRPDKKNPELAKAQQVAERLGMKPRFISSLGASPVKPYLDDAESLHFIDYLSGLGSSYYYQEYRPAKQLHTEGLLSPDTFVLPGHRGDMLGGIDLTFHFLHQELKDEHLAYAILNYESLNLHPAKGETAKLFERYLQLVRTYPDRHAFQRYERFFNSESAPKFTFNSARTWRYFGAEPTLLFDDNELSDFFFNLPFEYRWGKRIYFEALSELFEEKSLRFADDFDMRRALNSPSSRVKNLLRPLLRPLLGRRSIWRHDAIGFRQLMEPMSAVVAADGRFRPASINGLSFAWNYLRFESKLKELSK